jgi:hypothetical protein
MGTFLGTDPTSGTENFLDFFDLNNNFTPNAQNVYTSQTSPATFRYYITQGYVGVIGIHTYIVRISQSDLNHEKVTFEDPEWGGHFMAVQGFSSIGDFTVSACHYNSLNGKTNCTYSVNPDIETFTLNVNDPWFANRRNVPILTLKAGANTQTMNGVSTGKVRVVYFATNDDGKPIYLDAEGKPVTEMGVWPFAFGTNTSLAPIDVWSLKDGDTITVISSMAMTRVL